MGDVSKYAYLQLHGQGSNEDLLALPRQSGPPGHSILPRAAIDTYIADMAALGGWNAQVDHIVWEAHVVLRVLVGPLTMQQEVGIC